MRKKTLAAIRYFLLAVAMIAWLVWTYIYRIQTGPQDEPLWLWAIRVSTSLIYHLLTDLLNLSQAILNSWHDQLPPIHRFGALLLAVMGADILLNKLKRRMLKDRFTVYCERDGTEAAPIPGSFNRYRCENGHQFAGEAHGYES